MKTCSNCDQPKIGTHRNYCTSCYNEYMRTFNQKSKKKWYKKKRADLSGMTQAEKEAHHEARTKAYYAKHRSKLIAYSIQYAKDNKEVIAAKQRERYKNDPEYRARKLEGYRRWIENR